MVNIEFKKALTKGSGFGLKHPVFLIFWGQLDYIKRKTSLVVKQSRQEFINIQTKCTYG